MRNECRHHLISLLDEPMMLNATAACEEFRPFSEVEVLFNVFYLTALF